MSVAEKSRHYAELFAGLGDPDSQAEYLMLRGMKKPDETEIRMDTYRIPGCKTAIWLKTWTDAGRVCCRMDSDSLLAKGVLSILEALYEGTTPQLAAENPPAFLQEISDYVLYPEIKTNGLSKCYRKLVHF